MEVYGWENSSFLVVKFLNGAMGINGSVSKPCTPGEHQNSWDLWMFIPLKMVLIGIDPYPNGLVRRINYRFVGFFSVM